MRHICTESDPKLLFCQWVVKMNWLLSVIGEYNKAMNTAKSYLKHLHI